MWWLGPTGPSQCRVLFTNWSLPCTLDVLEGKSHRSRQIVRNLRGKFPPKRPSIEEIVAFLDGLVEVDSADHLALVIFLRLVRNC
jgi:hypothetical protein